MFSVGSAQNNPINQSQEVAPSRDGLSITQIAICVLKTLGVLLAVVGVGCLIAGLQVPAIAFLVSGVASWLLGFILHKYKSEIELSIPVQPLYRGTPEQLQASLDEAHAAFARTVAPLMNIPRAAAPVEEVLTVPVEVQPLFVGNPEEMQAVRDETEGRTIAPLMNSPRAPAAELSLLTLDKVEQVNTVPIPACAFGKERWVQFIGDPGEVPPLPEDIEAILAEPCPFWLGKTVEQTHQLLLVPQTVTRTVNGDLVAEPFVVKNLNKIIPSVNNGIKFAYDYINNGLLKEIESNALKSHWILITRGSIPCKGNYDSLYNEALPMLEAEGYELPTCVEASLAILLTQIRPRSFNCCYFRATCCRETYLNGFGNKLDPISVSNSADFGGGVEIWGAYTSTGVAGVRRLLALDTARSTYEGAIAPLMNTAPTEEVSDVAADLLSIIVDRVQEVNTIPTPGMAFGKEAWLEYIGDPGEVPPLPADIQLIIDGPCPFWPGKTVKETQLLVLIPKTVTRKIDGVSVTEDLNIEKLNEILVSKGSVGIQASPIVLNEINPSVEESHWILMMKKPLPGSNRETFNQSFQHLEYKAPTAFEAVVAILTENLRSETCFFTEKYIRCETIRDHWMEKITGQETMVSVSVGDFSRQGLGIIFLGNEGMNGQAWKEVAGIRRL